MTWDQREKTYRSLYELQDLTYMDDLEENIRYYEIHWGNIDGENQTIVSCIP